jgi:hypothetical protein
MDVPDTDSVMQRLICAPRHRPDSKCSVRGKPIFSGDFL